MLCAADARAEGSLDRPLYLLGGFGGATGCLASVITSPKGIERAEFQLGSYEKGPNAECYRDLLTAWGKHEGHLPTDCRSPPQAFAALRSHLERAREAPEEFFQNGLEKAENDRLMTTVDPLEASRLVLKGLNQFNKWRAD